jgi:hypothetical protein
MDPIVWTKKFYRDFNAKEEDFLTDLLDDMRQLEIEIPSHVISRMIQRGVMSEDAPLTIGDNDEIYVPGAKEVADSLDNGIVYEVSNEGIGRTHNPFRVVVAYEFEGHTLFVKIVPNKTSEILKVLDVWKKSGPLPSYPPPKAISQFNPNWDFLSEMERIFENESSNYSLVS